MGKSSLPKAIKEAGDYVRRARDQIKLIQYVRGRIGEDRSTVLDVGRVPDHGTGVSTPVAGQKRVLNPHLPECSPVTSEDDEPPVLKRPKRPESDSTVIDHGTFSPLTGSDHSSPVGGVKREAPADDLHLAEIASRFTDARFADHQWTT